MPSKNLQDWDVSTLVKFIREIFEKEPPLSFGSLTVENLRVVKRLTVRDLNVATKYHIIGGNGEPAFTNAWVNLGGSDQVAGYWKDAFGVVHLRGRISTGTINTNAFTLPPGCRPEAREVFSVASNGAFGQLEVAADGTVKPAVGSNVSFSLAGVAFVAV